MGTDRFQAQLIRQTFLNDTPRSASIYQCGNGDRFRHGFTRSCKRLFSGSADTDLEVNHRSCTLEVRNFCSEGWHLER